MKKDFRRILFLIGITSLIFSSCVTQKKYNELDGKRKSCEKENAKLKSDNDKFRTQNTELASKVAKYKQQLKNLKQDTTDIGRNYRRIAGSYKELNKNYNDLLQKHQKSIKGNQRETQKILAELQKAQTDLMQREDSLAVLEKEFMSKKNALDLLSQQLAEKDYAYQQLRSELERKDSAMNALRNSIADALVGFENDGLTITRKNGRVYVSMENKLLFSSGSFSVNSKGADAIQKLSKVLESYPEIQILVEGHTDNIPYNGKGNLNDNWDLSAKRATSIVRIITSSSIIDAIRITAAGRGEFSPVASNESTDGRSKNRRTDIILVPDLSILYDIVSDKEAVDKAASQEEEEAIDSGE
ncbi:MAG: OmpA family protein [Bacteroidales bacterium]|nr:OmpA family protein [Bacteroidales bacterium]